MSDHPDESSMTPGAWREEPAREEVPFSTGDLVVLRSGGPPMTVALVRRDGLAVYAAWFGPKGEYCKDWFMNTMIKKAPARGRKK